MRNTNQEMMIHSLKSFGSNDATGSVVVIVENDDFNHENRLKFTLRQNKSACVFMRQDNDNNLILDFYYPHARSPLCLHGALAAGMVHFNKNPGILKAIVITDMHKQRMFLEKDGDKVFLSVEVEKVDDKKLDDELVVRLLNIDLSNVVGHPVIASVGSPKLLIEVDTIDTLNSLNPNLALIINWGKENKVSGCYVYCKMTDKNYYGRNFNHLNTALEDSATGVAAGALSAYFKKDIDLFQGKHLNNPCVIHTKYLGERILIGGNVAVFSSKPFVSNL